MLLTGNYQRTLDDKKRLALAKRVREQLGEPGTLYVTPGPDGCLWLYTRDGLDRLAEKLDQSPATDAEARVFRRRASFARRIAAFFGLRMAIVGKLKTFATALAVR